MIFGGRNRKQKLSFFLVEITDLLSMIGKSIIPNLYLKMRLEKVHLVKCTAEH